jgi:hypothetical protein
MTGTRNRRPSVSSLRYLPYRYSNAGLITVGEFDSGGLEGGHHILEIFGERRAECDVVTVGLPPLAEDEEEIDL